MLIFANVSLETFHQKIDENRGFVILRQWVTNFFILFHLGLIESCRPMVFELTFINAKWYDTDYYPKNVSKKTDKM